MFFFSSSSSKHKSNTSKYEQTSIPVVSEKNDSSVTQIPIQITTGNDRTKKENIIFTEDKANEAIET